MYAIIETGGKQYRVEPGDIIKVEKLDAEEGKEIKFDKVLAMGETGNVEVGTPYLDATISAKVLENGKGKKIIIYKYKAKKDYRKKQGHRQPYTLVEITEIGGVKAPKKEKKAAPKKDEAKETATKDDADNVEETAVAEQNEAAETNEKASVSMSMKKDELIAFAEEHGIEVDPKATKQVLVDTINEKL